LLAAIAGVFLFLPALLFAVLLPPPVPPADGNLERAVQLWLDYYQAAWPWFLLQRLLAAVGTLAMLRLIFARETVGAALVHGLMLTPLYFLLWFAWDMIISLSLMLIIIPALYMIGRLAPLPAVLVAENRRNPLDVFRRTFALSRGRGWSIFGIIFVIVIVALIGIGVADTLFGLVFVITAGQDLGKLLTSVVASALGAALGTLLIMLYAALYRALAGTTSVAAAFE
jgi:hypothetical protein